MLKKHLKHFRCDASSPSKLKQRATAQSNYFSIFHCISWALTQFLARQTLIISHGNHQYRTRVRMYRSRSPNISTLEWNHRQQLKWLALSKWNPRAVIWRRRIVAMINCAGYESEEKRWQSCFTRMDVEPLCPMCFTTWYLRSFHEHHAHELTNLDSWMCEGVLIISPVTLSHYSRHQDTKHRSQFKK